MIKFNKPFVNGIELGYVSDAIERRELSGDGFYTRSSNQFLQTNCTHGRSMLLPSGTHALEMAALLLDIKPGDEVIMPSYTFVSTANAFALRGAKIIFIDIRKDTMNLDENLLKDAITERTRAIVVVHYAGVGCDMSVVMDVARAHNLFVIEDAAQALFARYEGVPLGSIGDIGCVSFHATKNYQCGEGGAIFLNSPELVDRAEVIREKGTNRSAFYQGRVDKYSWVDLGSSYLLSELNAAFLFGQLECSEYINNSRAKLWRKYYDNLRQISEIEVPDIPIGCESNSHIFFIKVQNSNMRKELMEHLLRTHSIESAFHYVPLHSTSPGLKYGRFVGLDANTTVESQRLLRLPLYPDLSHGDIDYICSAVEGFYRD